MHCRTFHSSPDTSSTASSKGDSQKVSLDTNGTLLDHKLRTRRARETREAGLGIGAGPGQALRGSE